MRWSRTTTLLVAIVLLTGCSHSEYELLQPSDLARHIGPQEQSFRLDPMEYRLRAYEDRLILNVFNPTDAPVQLLGGQSGVVDPGGQSHPLPARPIEPHSFTKLILPPPRPTVYSAGPTWGFGVGTSVGSVHHYHRHSALHSRSYDDAIYERTVYSRPRYLTEYDANDAYYWSWPTNGEVRMRLVFGRPDGSTFQDELAFKKVTVK